jgi:DNA polymerase III sliding clamp (beta) subunit (PCNA family)
MDQCTVDRKAFADAVRVASSVARRTKVSALRHIYIEASDRLGVRATDASEWVQINVPLSAPATNPWVRLVDADWVLNFLSSLPPSAKLTLAPEGEQDLRVDSCVYRSSVHVEDYPSIEKRMWEYVCCVPADALAESFHRTLFAVPADNDSGRFILNGVHLDCRRNYLNIVATDAVQLSWQRISVKSWQRISVKTEYNAVTTIPMQMAETVRRLVKSASDSPVHVFVATDDAGQIMHAEFKSDMFAVWGRVMEGKFPDYRNVLKWERMEESSRWLLNPTELMEALASVDSATIHGSQDKTYKNAKFHFHATTLVVNAKNNTCEATRSVAVKKQKGEETEVVLDTYRLMAFLKALPAKCGTVRVDLRDAHSATYWQIPGEDHQYLLMPIRPL